MVNNIKEQLRELRRRALLRYRTASGQLTINPGPPVAIVNYTRYFKRGTPSKRALLSYLVDPVLADAKGDRLVQFSNPGIAVSWPRALNELGYAVDIINWDDTSTRPADRYDLVVAHGAKNYALIKELAGSAPVIYFSTGSYWKFHNQSEKKRFAELQRRTGKKLPLDRYIYESEEAVNRAAHAIICLGAESVHKTYSDFPRVYNLPVASYPAKRPGPKDYSSARKNFLFFSGGGNVHKGLDLAIEAVRGTNLHLYICTTLDPEFQHLYAEDLRAANIHVPGYVNLGTPKFYEITQKNGFVILPSCSEGSPGSVVECMQQGLIPLVTPEAGLDVNGIGFEVESIKVPDLRKQLLSLATMDTAELSRLSRLNQQTAHQIYSPKAFRKNLVTAIMQAIGKE